MNIFELKMKLDEAKVDSSFYSLNGEISIDSLILYSYDLKWEVFYLDEKGNKNDEKIFCSEAEAYEYILHCLTKGF